MCDALFRLWSHANTTISAGVSLYPQDGETLHELKLKADAALHHVKEDGRNGWAIYRTEMSTAIPAKPGFFRSFLRRLSAISLNCGTSQPGMRERNHPRF
jgi:predicted signal transduction protein with EAL and GGDEF domain